MEILITLGVVFFIAYALLRLLAWIGMIWERGYLFAPTTNHGVSHTLATGSNELDEYFRWKAINPGRNIEFSDWKKFIDEPAFNIDGTPMIGGFDMNGNPYGFINIKD
jgi:hypothetical protein